MPIPIDRLSVCIETVFPPTRSYEEQIRAVASLGFGAYEFWYHDLAKEGAGWVKREKAKDLDLIARINAELGLKLTSFALNFPNGDHGGHMMDDKGMDALMRTLDADIPAAQRLGVPCLIAFPGYERAGTPRGEQVKRVVGALRRIDRRVDGSGVRILVEPLSAPKYKGYFAPTIYDVASLLREAGGNNLRILYDFFHIQLMSGNLITTIGENIDLIGHFHVSGVPGQHEPAGGEIDFPAVLGKVLETGYREYFGLEYRPLGEPVASLRETLRYLGSERQ